MSALPQFGVQAPAHDPQALARQILAQSRFRVELTHAPARTWLDTLHDWARDRWNQLIDAFAHHVRIGSGAGVAIGDALLIVLIAVIVAVLVRLLLGVVRESDAARSGAAGGLAAAPDPALLHASACEAAQSGQFAAAIALLYRAALAALDARGVLRDDPSRTVNECRRDVRRRAAQLSPPFERIARAFTAAVYAEDRVTAEHWNDAHAAYVQMAAVHAAAA